MSTLEGYRLFHGRYLALKLLTVLLRRSRIFHCLRSFIDRKERAELSR
jgi:hypothetical protein